MARLLKSTRSRWTRVGFETFLVADPVNRQAVVQRNNNAFQAKGRSTSSWQASQSEGPYLRATAAVERTGGSSVRGWPGYATVPMEIRVGRLKAAVGDTELHFCPLNAALQGKTTGHWRYARARRGPRAAAHVVEQC